MKIAVYSDLLPGGAHRATEEILKILQTRHQLEFYNGPKSSPVPPFLSRFFIDFESIVLQYFKQKKLAKEIDLQKYDLVFLTHDFHIHSPWILRFLKTPTVFLSQEPTRAFYEKFLDIEEDLPLHNRLYESLNRAIRKFLEESNVQFATKVTTSSYYSAESIYRAYAVTSFPAYPGIDSQDYHPIKISKKHQVMIVGNNEPQKDLAFAVDCLAQVTKKNRPKLVIASPRNTDMSKIKSLARKKQVELELFFGLDQKAMCRLYNESKITLAVAHLEPFGLSVIESLACGTPVVAVDEAGFRETIIQDKTGKLVDRDQNDIATTLTELLKDKDQLNRMGEEGRKDVNRRFTWDNTVDKLEKIFYETQKGKSRHNHS